MADKKTINLPKQKTFIFNSGTIAEEIDREVNDWLLQQIKAGKSTMLGKCFSNHDTGDVYYVFMYIEKVEI